MKVRNLPRRVRPRQMKVRERERMSLSIQTPTRKALQFSERNKKRPNEPSDPLSEVWGGHGHGVSDLERMGDDPFFFNRTSSAKAHRSTAFSLSNQFLM